MLVMRTFRRLPPFLRVVHLVRLLCFLAVPTLLGLAWMRHLWPVPPPQSALRLESSRIQIIAYNLLMLGFAGTLVISTYSLRFHHPVRTPDALRAWLGQVRAMVMVAALPTCALALAIIIPPAPSAFALVFPVSLMGAVVLIVAVLMMKNG